MEGIVAAKISLGGELKTITLETPKIPKKVEGKDGRNIPHQTADRIGLGTIRRAVEASEGWIEKGMEDEEGRVSSPEKFLRGQRHPMGVSHKGRPSKGVQKSHNVNFPFPTKEATAPRVKRR